MDLEDYGARKLIEAATRGNASVPQGPPKIQHPQGWVPGINTQTGEVIALLPVQPRDKAAIDWSGILELWGFDPDEFTVENDRVEVRTWTAPLGRGEEVVEHLSHHIGPDGSVSEVPLSRVMKTDPVVGQMWYYKGAVVRKWRSDVDLAELIDIVRKRKPLKRDKPSGESWLLTFWADTQLGKRDEGGTVKVVQASINLIGQIQDRARDLRKTGYEIGNLGVFGMGDLVEGCTGFYPHQEFQVELNMRDQLNVGTDMFLRVHTDLADSFGRVLSAAVPGNHGENRKQKGGTYTEVADNFDLKVWDDVRRVMEHNVERYGHVETIVPRDALWLQFQLGASTLSITHGHYAGFGSGGKAPYVKVWDWWKDHNHANTPGLWDSDTLVAAHYHHRFQMCQSGRMLAGCPALESGSSYFKNRAGLFHPQGLLTAVADDRGIHLWEVLDPWT